MTEARFIYDEALLAYNFHSDHPFNPLRIKASMDLAKRLGILDDSRIVAPEMASVQMLELAHEPHYIDLVRSLSRTGEKAYGIERLGLGTEDNPVFRGMHEAASRAVGASLTGARMLVEGSAARVLNLAGGLHHAGSGHAAGFCIYNDIVVAIRWIRRETGWRILYVDLDAHHGDGVQDAFYQDPDVFFVSFHESGQFLFPGTGYVNETGIGRGQGSTLNVPLAPATDDELWMQVLRAILPRVMEYVKPDLVVSQHGCDGHYRDPLADLCASTRFYDQAPRLLSQYIDQYGGRWLATGGGGYQVLSVVPRAWTLLWAAMAGHTLSIDTAVPQEWLHTWQKASNQPLPRRLHDDPGDFPVIRDRVRVEAANLATLEELDARFPGFDFEKSSPS